MGRWEFHTAGHLELYALANLLYPVELQQELQVQLLQRVGQSAEDPGGCCFGFPPLTTVGYQADDAELEAD
jgi:hypothetical protein